jgi:phosphoribosylaminoimidazolecarboxamide formyltransferase/IMP cyclohydrolase
MSEKHIKTALISVFDKEGLEPIVRQLASLNITIYTTGGTETFIRALGIDVVRVEDITGYPSILGGRVKTLHPNVFGGILAIRDEDHLRQLKEYGIAPIDLVVVDLYPFEDTVRTTKNESEIIEKIDIGGISLIRAAAKNFNDVVVIASKTQYGELQNILTLQKGTTEITQRKNLAAAAFGVSSHYDTAIFEYLSDIKTKSEVFKVSRLHKEELRYGENPHQYAAFFGDTNEVFEKYGSKELSYNNLVDIDAAIQIMCEFKHESPTFAILKHTNTCGIATRNSVLEAWRDALAGDPISAFGGILISNTTIDAEVALQIDTIFYEVLIAPGFTEEAKEMLLKKPKRVLLELKNFNIASKTYKSLLNGVLVQDADLSIENDDEWNIVTKLTPTESEKTDMLFALKCVKHLKSNTIVLVKNQQLIGMGSGQTSRVDACRQAIEKAESFGFDLKDAVMASDAFFPFPDCVELGCNAGIKAVIQPGGSIKDQLSIDFCDAHAMTMVCTGVRHFKH